MARTPRDRAYTRTGWHTRVTGTAKRPQTGRKRLRKANLNLTPRFSVTGSEPCNSPRLLAKAAKRLRFSVGRSRLFPVVPGTRDRRRTAATGERDRKTSRGFLRLGRGLG